MAYAKERWLAAAKKLFDLEYAAIKSVEQTYGTMVEDLPPAVFMCTLGSGQKDYVKKSRMAQDVTELCAEQFCDFGGKKLSLGELLAEHGLVRADEVADMVKLSPNYYMKNFNHLQAYYENPVNDDPLYTLNENEMVKIRYERNRYVYGGPQLSRARRRKIWKDAMETRDVHFLPTDQVIRYHRDNLNIYTKKELKDLRAQRAKDNASAEKAERGYDRNLETVYNWAMEYITQNAGVKLSEETRSEIKRLMAFHPLLYRKVDEDKLRRDPVKKAENHERNVSFYKKVMEFCGIGVPEEEKAKKKAEIFAYFRNTAETLLAAVGIERAEDFGWLESGKEEDALASGNAFALLEARHHMFDTLQYYTGKPDAEDWLSVEEEKDFRRALKKQIRFEVYRKTLRANYYVNLKDLGGRHDTGVGRDYLTLQYLGQYMSIGELTNIDFDRDILGNPEYVRVLAEYGIRFTSSTPINRPKAEAEKRRAEEEANRLAEQMADRESIKRRGEPDGGV